ncbi:MAG: TadE/TadG family type IV pilus assembly protein [Methylomonas sp.]
MLTKTHRKLRFASWLRQKEKGGVAIEFALAFPLFFTLFYAIVGYGLVMTLKQSLTQASKEGTRAAIKADPTAYANNADYQTQVTALARGAVVQTLSWLPSSQQEVILGTSPNYSNIQVTVNGSNISVTLTYPYSISPLLPVLTLPVIGKVPNVPDSLVVTSDGQL